jgi:maleylacetate reductase
VSERFEYEALAGRVVFGPGAARQALAGEADRLGAARILLLVAGSEEALARELAEPLGERIVAVFTAVRPHVPVAIAEAARELAVSVGADALLSIGGGSTTGTAKAVALTSGLPIIAVPTTYAGSEVTPVWGLTEAAQKTTGSDSRVLPRTVIYDPELTLTLPADLSAGSGLNAMAHCVEAFWAPRSNPISSLAAEEAIRVLSSGLPTVVADPHDLDARSDLLRGAYLAGTAFAVAGSGLHHKICHTLGGAFDLPHALTHAIVLPHVLAFNGPRAPEAVVRIGRALGVDDPAAGLRELADRLGIPAGLHALGMTEQQVGEAAAAVEPLVPADNPRRTDREVLHELIHAAWAGVPATTTSTWRGETP